VVSCCENTLLVCVRTLVRDVRCTVAAMLSVRVALWAWKDAELWCCPCRLVVKSTVWKVALASSEQYAAAQVAHALPTGAQTTAMSAS
jgi:hypothetical protein